MAEPPAQAGHLGLLDRAQCARPLGAAAITGLVEAYGMRGPLLGVGAVFLLVVLVGLGTPVRLRHPERTVVTTEAAGVAVSPR